MHGERIDIHKTLVRKPKGKRPVGGTRRKKGIILI